MSLLKTIATRHPLAMAAFTKWFTARNTLRPYGPLLRVPVEELPTELVYGLCLIFFAEQGVVMNTKVTSRGRMRSMIYMRRVVGSYKLTHTGRIKANAEDHMLYAITAAMRTINNKLAVAMRSEVAPDTSDVVIGFDVEDLIRQHKDQMRERCS